MSRDKPPSHSARQVRAIREAAGLTKQQMADKLGVTIRTIQNWEKHGTPSCGVGQIDNTRKLLGGD